MTDALKPRRSPIALAVLAALQAAAVHAQTAEPGQQPSQLPRISVSGEGEEDTGIKAERVDSMKFTQPLLETPQTVTVVRKEVILQQGAKSLTDTLRNVPGITFQLGENGNTQSGDTIFMRGFDTQNSIFFDGIRDLSPAVRDVYNIEQVEVFKGPAGADNGRGATSGYINLVSKLPSATAASSGTLAYGTSEHKRLTADWNQPVGDHAAFRLNLLGQDGGVTGRDVIERESWGIAPSFALGLGTNTRFYAFAQHVEQDNTPDGAVPTVGVADWKISAPGAAANAPRVDEETFYGLNSDFEDIEVDMLTLRLEHDFSDNTTLRNTSRYSRADQQRVLTAPLQAPVVTAPSTAADPSTWRLNRSRHASYRENELLTNQTNLLTHFATGSIQHSLASGVEFIYESQFTPTMGGFGIGQNQLAPTSLYNPDRNGVFTAPQGPLAPTGTYSDGNTVTSALYVFDTWELSPKWELTTGLRLEHFNTETDAVSVTAATPTAPAVTTARHFSVSDNLLNWKIAALYKPTEASSVYAAVASSYKPPGSDNFTLAANNATNANTNSSLDPQKALNLELGTKWDFLDGKLAATAALFKSTNKNDLARASDDPNVVIQFGEKEVKGIELGLVGQVTDVWQISAGLTRQDTEVVEGSIPASGGPSTQTGAQINFSPKLSATLWTTYRIIPSLTVGGGARHVSTSARSVSNVAIVDGVFKLPSFTVVDLYGSYQATDRIGIQLNVYNLFDEEYVGMVNNSGQRYTAGIPLSYLATVNFTF
jgi:catecholate siderophore receptor